MTSDSIDVSALGKRDRHAFEGAAAVHAHADQSTEKKAKAEQVKPALVLSHDVRGRPLPPGLEWVQRALPEAQSTQLFRELLAAFDFVGLPMRGNPMRRKKAPFVSVPVLLQQGSRFLLCIPGYRFPGLAFHEGRHPAWIDKAQAPAALKAAWAKFAPQANQALITLYEDGSVGIPPHSDKAKDLQAHASIVDLVLGERCKRPFVYEQTAAVPVAEEKDQKAPVSNTERWELVPGHGDLVTMTAAANASGEHSVPEVRARDWPRLGRRISIVWRTVQTLIEPTNGAVFQRASEASGHKIDRARGIVSGTHTTAKGQTKAFRSSLWQDAARADELYYVEAGSNNYVRKYFASGSAR